LAHPSSSAEPAPAGAVAVAVPVVDEADAPNELTMDERRVWMELAPWAMAASTLTPASAAAFVSFCRWEALSRALAGSVLEKGTNKHINASKEALKGYYDFQLRPTGKPMPGAASAQPAAVNPLERFLKRSNG
jgi:hypothetical protein